MKIRTSIKCPYYHKHAKLTIFCDSVRYPYNEEQAHRERPEDVKAHVKGYCCHLTAWAECPHAIRMTEELMKKKEEPYVWKEASASDGYELGRYKRKVFQMMEQEKKLKEQMAIKDIMLENALLYMMYLATMNAEIPCEYEIDYKQLKALANKYQVQYEPVGEKGMKLYITEKLDQNTEIKKQQ